MSLNGVWAANSSYQDTLQQMSASYYMPKIPTTDEIHKALALMKAGILADERTKKVLECDLKISTSAACDLLQLAVNNLSSLNNESITALREMLHYIENLYKDPDVALEILKGKNRFFFQQLGSLFCTQFQAHYAELQQSTPKPYLIEDEFVFIDLNSSSRPESPGTEPESFFLI